jgi:hypothetical protein
MLPARRRHTPPITPRTPPPHATDNTPIRPPPRARWVPLAGAFEVARLSPLSPTNSQYGFYFVERPIANSWGRGVGGEGVKCGGKPGPQFRPLTPNPSPTKHFAVKPIAREPVLGEVFGGERGKTRNFKTRASGLRVLQIFECSLRARWPLRSQRD